MKAKDRTAEALAESIVRSFGPPDIVEDVIEQCAAEWESLYKMARRKIDQEVWSTDKRATVYEEIWNALPDDLKGKFAKRDDDDIGQIIVERQAAFELGRAFERARLAGAR